MITAVILAKNEESSLELCLKSLNWCDETIVIDDFSTDKTSQVVQNFGAKLIKHGLNFDFASQRNFGLNMASGDWVFFVDTDEMVTPELQAEIKNKINTGPVGYLLKRDDYFLGLWLKHGETASVRLLRLAKKNAGLWHGKVHEVWKIKGEIRELDNHLPHNSHPTISGFISKINHYTELTANKQFHYYELLFPLAKFIQNYFLRCGFLDGFPGFVMAFIMSFQSLVTRVKRHESS